MLQEQVRRHALAHPTRTAVVGAATRVSYGELAERSTRLAVLLHEHAIGPGRLVAILLPRTPEVIVTVLAALHTGGAYTIVEDHAADAAVLTRLREIAADIVVTAADRLPSLRAHGIRAIPVDGEPKAPGATGKRELGVDITGSGPACVHFTSGSTGVPKGVEVTRDNIRHYVESVLDRLAIGEPLAYAHVSSLAADLGNTCLFLPLWTAGTIHLVDDATRRDPAALLGYLSAERVDFLKITPSHWNAVLRALPAAGPARPRLRYLVLGGEPLLPRLAAETLRSGVTEILANHYGPTETTIGVAVHLITNVRELAGMADGTVPIGTPLGRTRLAVRTFSGAYRYRSATGELYVGGPSVTAGYRGNPTATTESFVTDVDGPETFYRTGDLVRCDERGVLTFLGRLDRQVKVSGHRVELDHVESVLGQLPGVLGAAVCQAGQNGGSALAAAVVTKADTTIDTIRAGAGRVLARYMVPGRIVRLPALPRTTNGKTDYQELHRLLEASREHAREAMPDPPEAVSNRVLHDARASWERCLGPGRRTLDDDFFELGGSSLDAIQLIADLQLKGYRISARSFLARPTLGALVTTLTGSMPAAGDRPPGNGQISAATLTPAQRWFFRQGFRQPDHWNQALLLESSTTVDPEVLASAVRELVVLHPMLRTAYHGAENRWRAWHTSVADDVFTESFRRLDDDRAIGEHIRATAAALHRGIDLAAGRVFAVHLFRFPNRRNHLLLVGHHLAVDAVSWRIIVTDLVRIFGARQRGLRAAVPYTSTTAWQWAQHMERYAREHPPDLTPWRAALASLRGAAGAISRGGRERTAETVWMSFSRAETLSLTERLARRGGLPLDAAVLAAFLHALGSGAGGRTVVDVESHGRVTFDEDLDVSRVVGWFTSTFPVVVPHGRTVRETAHRTVRSLRGVPDLGVGFGLHAEHLRYPSAARICYNFLGRFAFGGDQRLDLSPSRFAIGPARGPDNDRVHDLRLTGRVLDDQLVLDLSFSPDRDARDVVTAAVRDTRRLLLELVDARSEPADRTLLEPGSSAGLLVYVPRGLPMDAPAGRVRDYRRVILTGATGFIGVHLLHELLAHTNAHVYCLVRPSGGRTAPERLRSAYEWYFPGDRLDADRCTVIAADLSLPDFGLSAGVVDELAANSDAIYHLAGDTRLVTDGRSPDRVNVDSLRTVIRLASTGKPKHLHYFSTLAVCGTNPRPDPVPFSEDHLDIGQEFLNEYERGKHDAERLVHEFTAQGGTAFIYRMGNVTGHTRTGRFQRNGRDNRFVQLLRAVLKAGEVPRDLGEVILSPVDAVVAAVLALSTCARLTGGTFHVDADRAVPYSRIFDVLRELGFPLTPCAAPDFGTLLERHAGTGDPDLTLGYFWAHRGPRNVIVDRTRTLRLLRDLGVRFDPITSSWLRRYLSHLIEQGHLPEPAGGRAAPGLSPVTVQKGGRA
jgi:amino acid adenylation domain-containing protein/thioester reductase-like protein